MLTICTGTRQKAVRDWINPQTSTNIRRFEQENSLRCPHTCDWIYENHLFKAWADFSLEQCPVFWIYGDPGIGKSVLSAHVIDTLQRTSSFASVVYQYYSNNEQYSALETYRNLADQLLDEIWKHTQAIPDHIHAHVQQSRSDKTKVLKLLELLIMELKEVYIFIDGLDEACDTDAQWREVKTMLLALCQFSYSNSRRVRIWISSQHREYIRKCIPERTTVCMTEADTNADIHQFLGGNAFLEGLDVDKEDRASILNELQTRARGIFLYAHLMVDSLQHVENRRELVSQIQQSLPEKLDDYYRRILAQVDKRQYVLYRYASWIEL